MKYSNRIDILILFLLFIMFAGFIGIIWIIATSDLPPPHGLNSRFFPESKEDKNVHLSKMQSEYEIRVYTIRWILDLHNLWIYSESR